jgi:uncharacterized membrane protein
MRQTPWSETQRRWLRGGLIVLAVTPAWIGIWGLVAPHSFYSSFPVDGRHWVAAVGPYDQHLVRDIAALQLGMLVLLAAAAVLLERTLVRVALLAYAIASLPHFIYHLTTIDRLSPGDNAASLAGLALQVVLPLGLLQLTRRPAPAADSRPLAAERRTA